MVGLLGKPLIVLTTLLTLVYSFGADDVKTPQFEQDWIWPNGEKYEPYFSLAPLVFGNRAECALQSNKPTESLFVFLDANDIGRAIYSVAKQISTEPNQITKEGMIFFRIAVSHLLLKIINRMLAGELPLFPHDVHESKTFSQKYYSLLKNCNNGKYCASLDSYINSIWLSKEKFDSKYVSRRQEASGCYLVKKFSSLHQHLLIDRPGQNDLQEISASFNHKSSIMTSCFDTSDEIDPWNNVLQIDLINLDKKQWEKKGFDFWNSVKIYLSWAWRNSQEINEMAGEFAEVFKSLP